MLDEQIRRFKLGRKICNDVFHDYLHPDNRRYDPKIHKTRVDGINEVTDSWEGFGYLSAVVENAIKHPKAMYRIFILKK